MLESLPVAIAFVVAGAALLWWGGDKLVEHAAHLARSCRVPKHVVGAVVLGFGTSLPELLVCLYSAHSGSPEIAIGNVVGSNIANVGLILGVAAVLSPVFVERKIVRADLPAALLAGVLVAVAFVPHGGRLGRGWGVALLAAFALYLLLSLAVTRRFRKATEGEFSPERHLLRDGAWIVVSLVMVGVGARLFVDGATGLAERLGVPSEVIGLSLVALGTSLPELVTTVQAARQGHPELAVGNIAGSNVFNLFLVLGTTGVFYPVPVSARMSIDVLVMVAFAVMAFPRPGGGSRIGRAHGVVLLTAYAGYLAWLLASGRAPA